MNYEALLAIVCQAIGRAMPVPPRPWPKGCGERTLSEIGLGPELVPVVIFYIDEALATHSCAALINPSTFEPEATVGQIAHAVLERTECDS